MTRAPVPGVRLPVGGTASSAAASGSASRLPPPAVAIAGPPPPPYPGLRPSLHVVNHSRLPVIPGGATVTAVPATIAGKLLITLIVIIIWSC